MECRSVLSFLCSSRRRHTRCALVTGVQTCALPISTSAAPARSPPGARLSLWIGIIASRLQIISQPDADRAWPERAVAAGEEGLRMDIGDRMIVEQVFDISGRDRKSTRLNSSH